MVYCDTGTAAEPDGLAIRSIHGFIEELVVNDDPEYQVHHIHIE